MESALDVLSRAASLIQNEKKELVDRKGSTGSNTSEDSGFEEPIVTASSSNNEVSQSPTTTSHEKYRNSKIKPESFLVKIETENNFYNKESKHPIISCPPFPSTSRNNFKDNLLSYKTFDSTRYKPYDRMKHTNITSQDFQFPSVDDHFRKSLGEKYDIINYSTIGQPPSSVDEHFVKALGSKWYAIDGANCNT